MHQNELSRNSEMKQDEVDKWLSALKEGDEAGVFSGSRMLFATKVVKRTPSGRVICEPGGAFKANGDIHGRLADQDRRLRPLSN
jgi:hypothetical protein